MTIILFLLAVSLTIGAWRTGIFPVVAALGTIRRPGWRGQPHPVRRRYGFGATVRC